MMADVAELPSNPDAPRSFDHAGMSRLPEYQAARRAVDALIVAVRRGIDDEEVPPISQADMAEAGKDLVLTAYAAEDCECCPPAPGGAVWPHAAVVQGDDLQGFYRCPRTGREWTCGWTADPTLIGMMP